MKSLKIVSFFLFITLLTSFTLPEKVNLKLLDSGIASWYGPGFNGKKTASGERFNTNKLTAAHKTLPFGTIVTVENKANKKRVKVKINDRGPYAKNRIIDLSKAAAKKIGMLKTGTATVNLYVEKAISEGKNLSSSPSYTVQIASYSDKKLASKKANDIPKAWVKSVKVKGKTIHRVYYGKFDDSKEANKAKRTLAKQKIKGFVKQLEN